MLLVANKTILLDLYWCIILPQMTGYIRYFDNGGKIMSLKIADNNVLEKYNKIWTRTIKNDKHINS